MGNKMSTKIYNNFSIKIASINGTGTQSSNNILLKTLFRMGIPVGGKNLFPSNIYGLATWFFIRANPNSFTSYTKNIDIAVCLNPNSFFEDLKELKPGAHFFYSDEIKHDPKSIRNDIVCKSLPLKELAGKHSDSIKIKKFLANMVYVGVLAQVLKMDKEVLLQVVRDAFKNKAKLVDSNLNAVLEGYDYAQQNLQDLNLSFELQASDANKNKILIDGNTAAGMGLCFAGCNFMAWYPITPSSSLAESYQAYAQEFLVDTENKNKFAVIQAEDELSSIGMVIGANWAGARGVTTTSGPGISLMSEFVGFSYFAEIPSVIWNVQRLGPSTGLPTRTSQADIHSLHFLGHGDTRHPVFFPANPKECFEDAKNSLDLAEQIQSFVAVASDLDLGMNFWQTDEFQMPKEAIQRGKVITEEQLSKMQSYLRYQDTDGDFIPYRSLPNNPNPLAAYFTRGTGHDEASRYTENNEVYKKLIDRLGNKIKASAKNLPESIHIDKNSKNGLLAFGSTDFIIPELLELLKPQSFNYLRIRAIPFRKEVEEYLKNNEKIFVIEQNRDGQMKQILSMDYPQYSHKLVSILHYDGLPIDALSVKNQILSFLEAK